MALVISGTANGSIQFGDGTSQNTAGTVVTTSNGYTKLPNGLILQWGPLNGTAANWYVTFPITFPTACLWVGFNNYIPNAAGSSEYGGNIPANAGPFANGVNIVISTGSNNTYLNWFAIGY